MLVGERMSKPVITAHPEMPIQDALILMRQERIRRLPVVDQRGRLVGIVSEGDLLHASPSDATSLSIWELNYMLSKIMIEEIMTREVITVDEGTLIEEAARIMADKKIGGLPVVRVREVLGIITETDLFKIFLELLGAREAGVRMSAIVPNMPGELAHLTSSIFEAGGNIIALGTFMGDSTENREVTIKVTGLTEQEFQQAIAPHIDRLVDVRTC